MLIIYLTLTLNALLLVEGLVAPLSNPWITPIPNFDAAMEGFDPVMSDPLERPDPGKRDQIFEPMQQLPDGRVVLNSFVDKVRKDIHCDSDLLGKTFHNYNQFKSETTSSFTFSLNADVSTKAGFFGFNFKTSAGYGRRTNNEQRNMLEFFTETNGEVVQVKAECITHTVSIAPFQKPVFTRAFQTALRRLNVAANNPTAATSNDIFVDFVKSYGTHFMKTTYLGSKISIEKLFTSRSTSAEKNAERSRCAANSLYASLGVKFGRGSVSTSVDSSWKNCGSSSQENSFFKNSGITSEKVISVGALPVTELSEWASTAKNSPVAIRFELEKISKLFESEWFDSILMDSHETAEADTLNGTAMHDFWEEKTSNYCRLMLGVECQLTEKGCGLNSDCPFGTCVNDPKNEKGFYCAPKSNGVIISGGRVLIESSKSYSLLSSVETMNTWNLPDFPFSIDSHTLTAIETKVYSCGGYYAETQKRSDSCYVIDTASSNPTWSYALRLPTTLHYHSAVAVGTNIWFVYHNKIYDLDTSVKKVKTSNLPFSVSYGHCAVSNGTHSYVIGVGETKSEIWMNVLPSNPLEWYKVANMARSRYNHECLWLETDIFITGGEKISNVEILNTQTHRTVITGSLNYARNSHRMIILDGKPAVVGGWSAPSNSFLNSIETYDMQTKKWTQSNRKMVNPRERFGLAQLHV